MEKDTLELIEEYNSKGVCVHRSINGYELPADKEPSAIILKNVQSITQKFFLTLEEAEQIYGFNPTLKKE